jgi:hypothetical protein
LALARGGIALVVHGRVRTGRSVADQARHPGVGPRGVLGRIAPGLGLSQGGLPVGAGFHGGGVLGYQVVAALLSEALPHRAQLFHRASRDRLLCSCRREHRV